MTEQEALEKVEKVIEEIPYITIASVTSEGKPWNSPVFAVHDGEYNFFWNSSPESQHSRNIEHQKDIFIVIYDSRVLEGEGFGVYIQAEAKKIPDEDLQRVLNIFYTKKGKPVKTVEEFLKGHQRFYMATPKKCWINCYDKTRMPADWKMEIKLVD